MNRRLVIVILSTLLVFMYIPSASQAASVEEATNVADKSKDSESETKLIGYIFKVLAKGLVIATDVDTLKTKCISKINNMSEEDFRVRYQDFYEHFSKNRVSTDKFGLHDKMTKSEAIELIKGKDKDKIFAFIDELPDTFIANEYKRYSFKNKQAPVDPQKSASFWAQINKMINSLKDKYL